VTATPVSPSFAAVLDDPAQLRELYREPHQLVLDKAIDHIDDGVRDFVSRSTFVLVGTCGADGTLDVSPRGGPAGFVKVLDDHRLAIPDLNGNNRLDTLQNIIATGRVGMLFVIPGLGETLRVNGAAVVTTDADVLDRFSGDVRRPAAAIGVTVDDAFIHCAKALRRGGLWDPATWPDASQRPSAGQILIGHTGLQGVTAEQVDADLEAGYELGLAADRPGAPGEV
jgi:PPOX class probable FMN-dependent enzyme